MSLRVGVGEYDIFLGQGVGLGIKLQFHIHISSVQEDNLPGEH